VFLLGSYLRLHPITSPKWKMVVVFGISSVAMYSLKLSGLQIVGKWGLLNNMSLLPLVWAVSLFCLMLNVRTQSGTKWLTTVSSASLTVYLVQENACFREIFWKWIDADAFADSPLYILRWVEAVIILWIISIVVNKLYGMLKAPLFMPVEQTVIKMIRKVFL
jgi:hypothetical protein